MTVNQSSAADEAAPPVTTDADWLLRRSIPKVAERIQVIREGSHDDDADGDGPLAPDPAGALRLLQEFARKRDIGDLLKLIPETPGVQGLAALDIAMVLTMAALIRPVENAAELAASQWQRESRGPGAGTPLTDGIIHDVTAQRIVPDVATFIAKCQEECHLAGNDGLVGKILDAFARPASGRTGFDKALLFITLRHQESALADQLLDLMLSQAGAQAADSPAGPNGQVGILAALKHLSPAEPIAEAWIDKKRKAADGAAAPFALVARLLTEEREDAKELARLARYVGASFDAISLVKTCQELARREKAPGNATGGRAAPSSLALVRGSAAARRDLFLIEVIPRWHESSELGESLTELLSDIIAARPDGRWRTPGEVDELHQKLCDDNVPSACCSELRVAAATAPFARWETGACRAELLGKVRSRDRRRAAKAISREFITALEESEPDAPRRGVLDMIADYLDGLQRLPKASASLTFSTLRALSEPAEGDYRPTGQDIGHIAAAIYPGSASVAFDLLERFLENEQGLGGEDAATIAGTVRRHPAMVADKRWYALLSATLGRWADTRRRDDVVAALRSGGYAEEAEAVIRSLR